MRKARLIKAMGPFPDAIFNVVSFLIVTSTVDSSRTIIPCYIPKLQSDLFA